VINSSIIDKLCNTNTAQFLHDSTAYVSYAIARISKSSLPPNSHSYLHWFQKITCGKNFKKGTSCSSCTNLQVIFTYMKLLLSKLYICDKYKVCSLSHLQCKFQRWTSNTALKVGTCKASWFDSIWNRTSDSRFDSYWWSDSKFSNRPRCQSSFVKKWLVVVKFAFKVDFGSKISVQQHCLARFMTELK